MMNSYTNRSLLVFVCHIDLVIELVCESMCGMPGSLCFFVVEWGVVVIELEGSIEEGIVEIEKHFLVPLLVF